MQLVQVVARRFARHPTPASIGSADASLSMVKKWTPSRGLLGAAKASAGEGVTPETISTTGDGVNSSGVDSGINSINSGINSINPKVASVKPSKTMALADLASSLKAEGVDVISLAAGEPDFDTPRPIIEAGIEALEKGITRYTPNAGVPLLKKKICEKLERENGVVYSPDEIVLSNGAKQSVWQGVLACCSPGDEVVIPAPFWVSYPEMARLAGAEPVVVETDSSQGFLMTADQLRGVLTEKSRLLILCSPSNPSGAVYSEAQLREIADVVREHPRLVVLSDEIYEYIVYGDTKHVSFASLPGMRERTLTVNGFSKAYAMTGWRLGYVAAPRVFAKACAVIQSQSTSGASSIAQHAAIAALDMGSHGGDIVRDMVVEFERRRDFVVSRLARMKGVKIVEPQGAFYALPDVSSVFGKSIDGVVLKDSDDVVKMLIEKANVAPVPGEAFGCPECIRISYACSMEELEEACNRMEKRFFDLVS